eukprot:1389695-Pyramimonas_sp.AAC.1
MGVACSVGGGAMLAMGGRGRLLRQAPVDLGRERREGRPYRCSVARREWGLERAGAADARAGR